MTVNHRAAASVPKRYDLHLSALAGKIEYALIAYPVGLIRLRRQDAGVSFHRFSKQRGQSASARLRPNF
jgi:hypothetical protein